MSRPDVGRTADVDGAVRVRSTPYPWPWNGLHPSELVLVLLGWDHHWKARVDPAAARRVAEAIESLATAVLGVGATVVTVSHELAPRAPRAFPPPAPLVSPAATAERSTSPRSPSADPSGSGTASVRAVGIDGFHGSALDSTLRARGATQLLLGGFGMEAPVHSTLRSANDRGYECLLVADASAELEAGLVDSAQSQVCMSGGIFGAVATSNEVLDALSGLPATRSDGTSAPEVLSSPTLKTGGSP